MSAKKVPGFPLVARIGGIEVVTIPAVDYAELLENKRLLAERAISHEQVMSPKRSKVERNPEVAFFLTQKFGLVPLNDALKECRRRFGKAATPSRSAAYRYWDELRKAASKAP